jgi:hypothetical protein
VEIVKCIALLRGITDVEDLHESLLSNECGSLHANQGTRFKESRINNSVITSAKQAQDLYCEFLDSPPGSTMAEGSYLRGVVIQSHHYANVIILTQSCISVHKSVYKPGTNAMS